MWRFKTSNKSKAILKLNEIGNDETLDYEAIESVIGKIDGIYSARINAISNTIKIEFDQKRITIEQLRDTVKKVCEAYTTPSVACGISR